MKRVLRARYLVLAAWAAIWLVLRWDANGDWQFFVTASGLLRGARPLSTYSARPDLQIGPAALVAALPLTLLPAGVHVAHVLIHAMGLVSIRCAELVGRSQRRRAPDAERRGVLLGGLLLIPLWSFVASSGHLDDAMALTCLLAAMLAVTRGQPGVAGVALGLAVSAKPWAVVAAAVLMGLPNARAKVQAMSLAGAVVLAFWLPFVVGDPLTVSRLSAFRIPIVSTSGLHLVLGMATDASYPPLLRPAQLVVGLALACLAARRGRWWAGLLVGIAVRLVLDPGAAAYYGAGVGLGALVVDLVLLELPLMSLVCFATLCYPAFLQLVLLQKGYGVLTSPALRSLVVWSRVGGPTGLLAVLALVATRHDDAGGRQAAARQPARGGSQRAQQVSTTAQRFSSQVT